MISGLVTVSALVIGIAMAANKRVANVNATECEHEGFHYNAKAADIDEHGHKEFWACCKCHEAFLSNPGGTFVDADDSTMSGGMAPSHIAYIPSELEGLAAEAVVKSYSPHSYYEQNTTYEFDIVAGTTDLIATNATVASAYSTASTNAVAHKANRTQVEEDYAAFRAVLVEEYGKFMVQNVKDVLIGTYGVVNNGVIASTISNGHLNCGTTGYYTWVAVNPTDKSWGPADNRSGWIPTPYLSDSIIAYAEAVRPSLTTMSEGVGFGPEGDYKTSALMAVLCKMSESRKGATGFLEDYTYDLCEGGELELASHMLEVSPVFASNKPKIEVHPLGIGGKEDPARLVFDGIEGKGIAVSMIDMGTHFRLICADIELIKQPKPMPKLPVARVMWKILPNFAQGTEEWINAGGAHHAVISTALTKEDIKLFAKLTNTELVVIS